MHAEAREELKKVISIHGRCICHDPDEFEKVMTEACPQDPQAVKLLILALQDRVPGRLLAMPQGMPWEATTAPLIPKLVQDLGITQEEARWTIDSWGLALLKVHQKDLDESHKPPEPVLVGADDANPSPSGSAVWRWLTGRK